MTKFSFVKSNFSQRIKAFFFSNLMRVVGGIFLFSFFSLVSNTLLSEKYESDIAESEKRILDYKKEGKIPDEMKLFYKGKEGDYIVFYDLDGQEIFYKYRRNRFDLDSETKLIGLHRGQAYRIKGRFRGIFLHFDPKEKKHIFPPQFLFPDELTKEQLENRHNKPAFVLESYESTALDEVIH